MSWKVFFGLVMLCAGATAYGLAWSWFTLIMIWVHAALLCFALGVFMFFWLFGERTGAIAAAPPEFE